MQWFVELDFESKNNSNNQDCVQIGNGPDYTWDDEKCTKLYPFVCERGGT